MVPNSMPVVQVEDAIGATSSSTCSGRASVVKSRSCEGRPITASRTVPPTRCSSKPAAAKAVPRAAAASGTSIRSAGDELTADLASLGTAGGARCHQFVRSAHCGAPRCARYTGGARCHQFVRSAHCGAPRCARYTGGARCHQFVRSAHSRAVSVPTASAGNGYHRAMSKGGQDGGEGQQGQSRSRSPQQGSRGKGEQGGQSSRQPRRRRTRWLRQVDEFSAGGLVLDLRGDVPRGALIARTDRHGRLLWSLPKGHIEAGETAEQAAIREV